MPLRAMPLTIQIEGREALTINQACRRVNVSRRTMHNWVKLGKVEYRRLANRAVRIFADSLVQPKDVTVTPKKDAHADAK